LRQTQIERYHILSCYLNFKEKKIKVFLLSKIVAFFQLSFVRGSLIY